MIALPDNSSRRLGLGCFTGTEERREGRRGEEGSRKVWRERRVEREEGGERGGRREKREEREERGERGGWRERKEVDKCGEKRREEKEE